MERYTIAELELESGARVLVQALERDPEREVADKVLRVRFEEVLAQVREVAQEARSHLGALQASSVELKVSVGLAVETGRLVALLGGAKVDAGIELSFTWENS